jgi:hypothetical protein
LSGIAPHNDRNTSSFKRPSPDSVLVLRAP